MSVNPKSTQLPVTNMVASMRVVGFARNVLSLSIESVQNAQDRVRVKRLITLTRWPLKCSVSAVIRLGQPMTKTELQIALAEATQTNRRTAAPLPGYALQLAYKAIKKEGEFLPSACDPIQTTLPAIGELSYAARNRSSARHRG
jgi:hypothetical protein